MAAPHEVEEEMGLSCSEILDVIQRSDRCYQMVRGFVAEKHLENHLTELKREGVIDEFEWIDEDGQPDFRVEVSGEERTLECKNVMSSYRYASGEYKLDFQKTRNARDSQKSRYYKPDDFDLVAACEYNQTGTWTFKFVRTEELPRTGVEGTECCEKNIRVPDAPPLGDWTTDLSDLLPAP